jgi:hypothetical protein
MYKHCLPVLTLLILSANAAKYAHSDVYTYSQSTNPGEAYKAASAYAQS